MENINNTATYTETDTMREDTTEDCPELLGTLDSAYREWMRRKKLSKQYGTDEGRTVDIIEEAYFHYLPYGVQIGIALQLR